MKPTAPKKTLAVVKPLNAITPQQRMQTLLKDIATILDTAAPEKLAETLTTVKEVVKALDYSIESAQDRLITHVLAAGEPVPETKGTFEWNGVKVRPTRTTLDPKKVEGLLRAKNLDVNLYMDKKLTYVVNETRVKEVLNEGEQESCRYELKYQLSK